MLNNNRFNQRDLRDIQQFNNFGLGFFFLPPLRHNLRRIPCFCNQRPGQRTWQMGVEGCRQKILRFFLWSIVHGFVDTNGDTKCPSELPSSLAQRASAIIFVFLCFFLSSTSYDFILEQLPFIKVTGFLIMTNLEEKMLLYKL